MLNLKILILEDNESDADLLNRELKKSGLSFTTEIVQTRTEFENALDSFDPDLILSDYSLPSFDAVTAFRIKQNKHPHTPFIIVSGIIGEENAVELIKAGVTDYVSKSKLFTLSTKINRALNDTQVRKEKIEIDEKLKVINQELSELNQELEVRVVNRTKALAESESRFRSMMETIPQIAWTNTVKGEVDFYNQRWYNYTGLHGKQTKLLEFREIIHPDDVKISFDQFRSILKTSDGGEFQIRIKRIDGLYMWHLIRLMPITDQNGNLQLWVGTATDIQELRVLQQHKDDFIIIASHELKTPVTSLKASLQLLDRIKDNPPSTMLSKLIVQANKSLGKVNALIEDLLNSSMANQGQLHINQQHFVLSEAIKECCYDVCEEGIYTIKIEGDMRVEVYADTVRIGQIVSNFINNAIKYAPESKEIRICIEKVNDMVKVSVIDNGPGIQPEKQRYLFDRYYRAENTGSQYTGLGLGLYICAEIIKKHCGLIGVESELDKGSAFWFTLPLVCD
ncbi:hybrid sensor histidine kinase/response regulator [Pedobacter nyackensis]|uniref:histidine kinase n=1 Tax=Pedobacter nyackensis TaxID=475255 RepID=A0A1W2APG7_9SPHI|nr:ATP-binding protein [Pedobacter nyackensis]SMC62585.1 PAS domain S-box-containing protein [Pedobacter nyackensis]